MIVQLKRSTAYGKHHGYRQDGYLDLRIERAIKEALRSAAEREHRSVANMVEVMIRAYCSQAGIEVPGQHAMKTSKNQGKAR